MTLITQKAMLASLSISRWGATKQAPKVVKDATVTYGTKAEQLSAKKSLVATLALKSIKEVESQARQYHLTHTQPWLDEGARILSSALYFEYSQSMTRYRQEFDREVTRFLANYPMLIADAEQQLAGLYDPNDYPSPDKIAAKFAFKTTISPLPAGEDFRVSLGAEEEERLRADISARLQAGVDGAMRDAWKRVHTCVAAMAERLNAYEVIVDPQTGQKTTTGVFRDSLVQNMRDLVDILPGLNITGDAELTRITAELETSLCVHEPEILRANDRLRRATAERAEDILAQMAGYIGEE